MLLQAQMDKMEQKAKEKRRKALLDGSTWAQARRPAGPPQEPAARGARGGADVPGTFLCRQFQPRARCGDAREERRHTAAARGARAGREARVAELRQEPSYASSSHARDVAALEESSATRPWRGARG